MEYTLIYSDRKTLSVSIRDGEVIVRAPKNTPMKRIEAFLNKHRGWILEKLAASKIISDRIDKLTDKEIAELKREARRYLTVKTEYYANIMGINYSRISITSAKTRFGSCSSKGNICYSYRLMLYPEAAREYVVVHELAHIKEMNHSKKFYKIIESVLPDYKERKRLLK